MLPWPDKHRGSAYATTQRMASALADDELRAWTSSERVHRFDLSAFIRSTDTAALLSKDDEGPGRGVLRDGSSGRQPGTLVPFRRLEKVTTSHEIPDHCNIAPLRVIFEL